MPKPSAYALIWSDEHQSYDLHLHGQLQQSFHLHDESAWLAWVQEHTTVAFHGQAGHLSLIKEARPRGSSYWYAYRRQARRTYKRYLGPSARLTFAHLEQIATQLTRTSSSSARAPEPKASSSWEQRSPLLSAKLSAPRLPSWLVERSRLLRELDAIHAYPLTLVSASAGSGKTTLLSAWVAAARSGKANEGRVQGGTRTPQTACAWLSLDALDREPIRFWTSVVAALQTALPTVGQTAFTWFHAQEAPPLSAILTNLLQELEQIDRDLILILDDYQVITEQSIQEALLFVLEHLPANVHLVLVTRADPALPLSRLRMRGQLLEVRDQDLRFNQAEATSFLIQGMGLPLSEEEVAILEARTEGWVAGLQLATLALRKREDRSAFVQDFAGSHRYLLDYVQQDILAHLPVSLQAFLLQTAILPRMHAALCQAVTAGPSLPASQQLLEELERANLFVVPLDDERQWYRYHDLFREALLAHLRASQPEVLPVLHQRAARFYEATGEIREAITHALAAADYPWAARLIEQAAPALWLTGEAQTVYHWLVAMPDALLWHAVHFVLTATLRLLDSLHDVMEAAYRREQIQVEQTLTRLETLLRGQEEGSSGLEERSFPQPTELPSIQRRLRLLRALVESRALLRGPDGERLSALAQEVEALGEDEEMRWKMVSLSITFWLVESVQREGALLLPRLLEAKQQAQKAGDWLISVRVLEWLAFAYSKAGQWHQVEREGLAGLALVEQRGGRTAWAGYLHHLLFYAYYAWNRLDDAADTIQRLLQIARDWQQVDLLIVGYLDWAQLACTRGDLATADQALQQAEALIRHERLAFYTLPVAGMRAQYWLAAGHLEAARSWAEQVAFAPHTWDPNHKGALLAQIQVFLALHRTAQSLELLDRFRAQLDRPGDPSTTQEFLASCAVALYQAGKEEPARAAATRLLAMTEAEGSLRVYLDAGPAMKQVLQMLLSVAPAREGAAESAAFSRSFVLQVLAAFAQEEARAAQHLSPARVAPASPPALLSAPPHAEASQLPLEPFSAQERKVLQLLVAGNTYAEMAHHLIVSPNTIKTQVSSIYRKLGVSRRAQAIAAARQLPWLSSVEASSPQRGHQ